ncbi:MAG: sodium:solute symporter [Candidatus Hydrogenedentes bacterium]|nr:sodium:solute symporter [Candidatus Hydrogenedentota bacterium]
MNYLNWVDYAFILAYVFVVVLIGYLLLRKASGSLEDYYLGGRKLPWYLLGSSGMAQWFDLTGTMIITSFLFMIGPRGLFIEFRGGAVLVLIFMIAFTGKWHRRSGCITGAEWMVFRFGKGRDAEAARFLTAVVTLILTVGMTAYLVRGTGLFLSMFFPYTPTTCALALLVVATIYTMFSGFYGVVVTDLLQSGSIVLSAIAIAIGAFLMIPDQQTLSETALRVTQNANWTDSLPAWHVEMPPGYDPYEMLLVFAIFYLVRNVIGGLGSGTEPRYFGARSDRECGLQSMLVSVLTMVRWPMMMGLAVLGILMVDRVFGDPAVVMQAADFIKQHYPGIVQANWHDITTQIMAHPADHSEVVAGLQQILGNEWMARLPLVGYNGVIDPERILPAVILDWIPMGLRGMILVSVLAASMSTFDSALNMASGFFVRDIYQRWMRPAAANRELIFASYGTTIVLAAMGFYMGVAAENINDIWGWIIMGLGTGMMVPNFLRLYWWRMNGWGVAIGLFVGGAGAIYQRLYFPDMDERLQFLWMASVPLAATILGCLLTRPTPHQVLEYFYRKTRPFGVWGPMRASLNQEERAYIDRENRYDIISLPFIFVYQVTLFLLPMQIIIHAWSAVLMTLPVFLGSLAGIYWFWYRHLPDDIPPFPGLNPD